MGTIYAGLVVAPLNLMHQSTQLEYVMEHSDTQLVFCTTDHKKRLAKAAAAIDRPIELIKIDNDEQRLFPIDKDLDGVSLPEIHEDDDALLLYTPGTTGIPKGVILSHKNVVTGGQNTSNAHELTPEDRALCSLPLYQINGEIFTACG